MSFLKKFFDKRVYVYLPEKNIQKLNKKDLKYKNLNENLDKKQGQEDVIEICKKIDRHRNFRFFNVSVGILKLFGGSILIIVLCYIAITIPVVGSGIKSFFSKIGSSLSSGGK